MAVAGKGLENGEKKSGEIWGFKRKRGFELESSANLKICFNRRPADAFNHNLVKY